MSESRAVANLFAQPAGIAWLSQRHYGSLSKTETIQVLLSF
jgi:hypothetical protein